MVYITALSKVLPVLLLFLLGAYLRRRCFFSLETVQDLKKLVVNVTLPAVLFLAFSGTTLELRQLIVVGLVFAGCLVALLYGALVGRWAAPGSPYFPLLMAGFEAGMMGYAIFGAVYGQQNIYKFALIDLGQVLFVFFVLVTLLQRQSAGAVRLGATVAGFFKTPVIIAILLGVIVNQVGLIGPLNAWPVSAAFLKTLEMLSLVTTPIIGLIIGYEMRLARSGLGRPLLAIGLRLLFWVPVGLLLNAVVIRGLLGLDRTVEAAVMTMFVLPPPFVMPLFIPQSDTRNMTLVVNTLSLATLVTLFAFAIISVVYAA
jgi:malate permease and related proteins